MFSRTNNYTLGMKIKEGIKKTAKKGYSALKDKLDEKIQQEKEISKSVKEARFKEKKRIMKQQARREVRRKLNAGNSSRGDDIFTSGKSNDYFGGKKKGGGFKWF